MKWFQSFLSISDSEQFGKELSHQLTLICASEMETLHVPPFPPDTPAVIGEFASSQAWTQTIQVLMAAYPPEHEIFVGWHTDSSEPRLEWVSLLALKDEMPGMLPDWLYLPGLALSTSFESLQEVIAHLRAPDGCPWDREQTHQSLRPYLLEETYEAITALDSGDTASMLEEFGDLLLQIVLHAQIASEEGSFRMSDVLRSINHKLIRRHPHVFGDTVVDGVGSVLQNWEKLKADERKSKGKQESGVLDGVPLVLPALVQAQEYQKRAARIGFDWPDVEGILAKICEEAVEVSTAENASQRAAEIGDLLFAVVNLARYYQVDSESMLRETSNRFRKRFEHIEATARAQGRSIAEMTLTEMDDIWEAAKAKE